MKKEEGRKKKEESLIILTFGDFRPSLSQKFASEHLIVNNYAKV
jgi:hypothetical protein